MEDKKTNELLQSIWGSLTDEQKEKVQACKNAGEVISLAAQESIELPDEALNAIAGGGGKKGDKPFTYTCDPPKAEPLFSC